MAMTPEHREAVRGANKRRGNCPNCNNSQIEEVDGSRCGGLPGVTYRRCNGCGWVRAKTRKPRKADNPLFDRPAEGR